MVIAAEEDEDDDDVRAATARDGATRIMIGERCGETTVYLSNVNGAAVPVRSFIRRVPSAGGDWIDVRLDCMGDWCIIYFFVILDL